MANKSKKFSTKCVHEGEIKDTMYQGIVSPLFMSTTYPWYGGEDAEKKPYPRYFNTPNQEFLSKKIAALENGEKALIFTSGMAAISTSIMANVKTGDHVIFQEDLYGGTRNFIKTEFDKYGIEYSFTKGLDSKDFLNEVKNNTVGIYVESPSNPLLKIVDLRSISLLAKHESKSLLLIPPFLIISKRYSLESVALTQDDCKLNKAFRYLKYKSSSTHLTIILP